MFNLPTKAPGERLEAAHVNELNRAARLALLAGGDGGGLGGIGGRAFARKPFLQVVVEIKDATQNNDGTTSYTCYTRYYDRGTTKWATNTDSGPYDLDTDGLGNTFQKGDDVVAYWDEFRAAFVPTGSGGGIARDIDFHLSGTLSTSDATTTNFAIDSYNNGSDPAANKTKVTLQNMPALSGYIFHGANGAHGWATLVSTDATKPTYRIRQMECPT